MKPTVRYKVVLVGAAALALGTAAFASLNAAALSWPTASVPGTASLATVHEARADAAILKGLSGRALAADESRRALSQAPLTASAWLRLAYLRHQQVGSFDAQTVEAIERSYAVSPLNLPVGNWRMRFLFENWSQVPAGLRTQAMTELRLHARHKGDPRLQIQDPAGRMASNMVVKIGLDEARREKTRDRGAANSRVTPKPHP